MPDETTLTPGELAPWLDNAFLEAILRRDEHDDSLVVVSNKSESAVPVGDHYASFLLRVAVEYNSGDNKESKTRSLIVKSVPTAEIMQQWIAESGIFRRELNIYAVTLPAMNKLYLEKTGERIDIGPKFCPTDRPNTIVLDDLRPLGYKMANRREGLDLIHSVRGIKSLAKFHAISMVMNDEDPSVFDFYTEPFYTEENRKMMSGFMEPMFNNLATEVESWPGSERYGKILRGLGATSIQACIDLAKNKEGALKVLNHGDFWTNNMLFRYDEDGKIDDIKMLDFQIIRFASPALDILYFLNMSANQHILEENKEELIDEYLNHLNATVRRMGSPHLALKREQIDQELKDKAFFAVIVSSMLSIIVAEPEDAPDMSSITQEDLDTGNFTQMNKAFAGKRFRYSFERRLVQFEAEGLI